MGYDVPSTATDYHLPSKPKTNPKMTKEEMFYSKTVDEYP